MRAGARLAAAPGSPLVHGRQPRAFHSSQDPPRLPLGQDPPRSPRRCHAWPEPAAVTTGPGGRGRVGGGGSVYSQSATSTRARVGARDGGGAAGGGWGWGGRRGALAVAREPPKQSRPPHACAVPTVNMGLMVDRLPWRADVKVAEGPRWRWWAQSSSWGRPGRRSCAQLGQGRPWPRGPRTALLGLACLLGQARPCGFVERVPQLAISESSTSIASWVRTLTVADSLRESLGSCVLDCTAVRDERLYGLLRARL